MTKAIAPDDPQIVRRLLAGTLVFGVTFSVGMIVGQNAVAQRFMGNLRLLVTMPMSKGAYVLGSLAFSSISGAVTVLVLLGFGVVTGIGIEPVWTLAPTLVLAVLTLAGLTMFVVSFAPSAAGGEYSNRLVVAWLGGPLAGLLYDGNKRHSCCGFWGMCRRSAMRQTPSRSRYRGEPTSGWS